MVRIDVSASVFKNAIPNYFLSDSLTLFLHFERRLEPTKQIQSILFSEGQKGLEVRLSHWLMV